MIFRLPFSSILIPNFLQLCLEKSSRRAWTACGAVQVSSSRSPAKFANYETLQHKLGVQSQPPAKDMEKMVQFETPALQRSIGFNWRQPAWPGFWAGQLSNVPRPSIHSMSRFFHAGLGGQWKSTNADILAGLGFPVCIDFQLSFCSAWHCKSFMDLVCKLSPWLIDAAISWSGCIGLGIHVLPFHVNLSQWPSGWIRSIKFMSKQLQTGINRFATLSHYDLRHGDRHWVILTTIQALNSDYPSPPSRFNSYLCRSIIDAWPFSHGSETCVLSTLQNPYNIAHWFIGILTMAYYNPYQWAVHILFTVNNHCFGCY